MSYSQPQLFVNPNFMELPLYLIHLISCSGLTALAFLRIAGGMVGGGPGRQDAGLPVAAMVLLWFLALCEAASGVALLFFPKWRESAFSGAMAILLVLWALMVIRHFVGRHSSAEARQKLPLVEKTIAFACLARVIILAVVALI